MRRDWTALPVEILQLISENLNTNFVDLYRFRSVCKSWGLVQLNKPQNPPPQLPWLLLPSLHNNRCRFYSLSDETVYHLPPSESFSSSSCCRRSSLGWLLMIEDDESLTCALLNPLSGVTVSLPSMKTAIRGIGGLVGKEAHEKRIWKVVLSATPNFDANEEVIVMLVYGDRIPRYLLYSKLGDKAWKRVMRTRHTSCGFEDVTYFKGQFYAVESGGQVGVCDFGSPSPRIRDVMISIPESFLGDKIYPVAPSMNYLVESSGELLLIRRFRGKKVQRTIMFKVFKEDPLCKSWVEVRSLGGHALFLGYNHSSSLLASNYFRCKANCIYFTDNIFKGVPREKSEPHDVGIFNLETGVIGLLPGYWCDHLFLTQPPILVTPSPW